MQRNSLLVPHATIVRALNAQSVGTRGQRREGSQPVFGIHSIPGMVKSLEHVPILVP